MDRLAQPQAVEKAEVSLQSQEPGQEAPTAAIELKETTPGEQAYRVLYDKRHDEEVEKKRLQMRMERYQFE